MADLHRRRRYLDAVGRVWPKLYPVNADFGKLFKVVVTGTGDYSGVVTVTASSPTKLSAALTPYRSFLCAAAPGKLTYTVGAGVLAASLGAAHFGGLTIDGTAVSAAMPLLLRFRKRRSVSQKKK